MVPDEPQPNPAVEEHKSMNFSREVSDAGNIEHEVIEEQDEHDEEERKT